MQAEVKAAYAKAGMPAQAHIPPVGSLPVTVPGTVDAWGALHDKFGKLSLADDLAPAIAYAKNGFPVTQLVAQYWKGGMAKFEREHGLIEESANARHTYLIDGHTPVEGEVFRNPDLARTLTMIAEGGRDAFYKGAIAHTIESYFKRIGGDLRYADFAGYHGEWVTPQSVNYHGYDVYELPPNGQGFAALEMLQILKGFDLKKMGAGSADAITAMLEAKRLAYEDLAKFYADPRFVDVPMKGLLSEAYADQRRKLIHLDHANANLGPGHPKLFNGDTTYFTTADKDGMMVSIIQSNYRGMGSGLMPDGLGFMFQDRGELFALTDGHPNVYAPGKRPFQTIIPGFATQGGKPLLSFGVMGGDMQPQGQAQVISNMVDHGLAVQEAGDAPRWHHDGGHEPTGEDLGPIGRLNLETGVPKATQAALAAMGWPLVAAPGGYGGYECIQRWPGRYAAATEMRKDGVALAY
jgi:gamma-glutamyltranspeptidase/glutathione hydrolase